MSAREAEAVEFLRALIAAQTEGEAKVQAIVAERLSDAGCIVDTQRYTPAEVPVIAEFAAGRAQAAEPRETVIATLPGAAEKRSLLLFAHPDSEPVDDITGWSHDPFAGTVDGGKIFGWGVADDLAGVAAGVLAMTAASEAGLPLGQVTLASAPSKRHARGVAAALHNGLEASGAVYLHPAESGAGLGEIKAFASGQLEFRVSVSGCLPPTTEPGHTGFAHLGENPVDKALLLIAALKDLDAARAARIHHPRLEAAVSRSTNLMVSNFLCGADRKFSRLNESATFGGALSFPPGETLDDIKAEVAAAIDAAAKADAFLAHNPPTIEWIAGVTGADCPDEHPLYQCTAAAIRAATGQTPSVNPMHTSSDIRNPMVQKNIPTVGIGGLAGDLTQNGRTDEWVDLADFLRMVDATSAIVRTWCAEAR
ncbi:MAG: M20/M25/M40 family metallo-hydrolase [Pseudomonadota bacterium]